MLDVDVLACRALVDRAPVGAALKLVAAVDLGAVNRAEEDAVEALADAPAWAGTAPADVEAPIGVGASAFDGDAGGTVEEFDEDASGTVEEEVEATAAVEAVGGAGLAVVDEDDDVWAAAAANACPSTAPFEVGAAAKSFAASGAASLVDGFGRLAGAPVAVVSG